MTMKKDPTDEDLTARDIVNTWGEESIADIIFGFGEEKYSRRIAKAIVTESPGAMLKGPPLTAFDTSLPR